MIFRYLVIMVAYIFNTLVMLSITDQCDRWTATIWFNIMHGGCG
jgi:hypothetical protein